MVSRMVLISSMINSRVEMQVGVGWCMHLQGFLDHRCSGKSERGWIMKRVLRETRSGLDENEVHDGDLGRGELAFYEYISHLTLP